MQRSVPGPLFDDRSPRPRAALDLELAPRH